MGTFGDVSAGKVTPLKVALCICATGVAPSVTVTVAAKGPAAVGLPLIKPVEGSIATPLGRPVALQ